MRMGGGVFSGRRTSVLGGVARGAAAIAGSFGGDLTGRIARVHRVARQAGHLPIAGPALVARRCDEPVVLATADANAPIRPEDRRRWRIDDRPPLLSSHRLRRHEE